jgi:hypothetical protein
MFRLFSVKFDRFLSASLRRSPGKIFLSFSIIREYLSDSQRIPQVYHYSMIATLEIRVLISSSASFSEKVDTSSSPDRLQVAAPPFRSASSVLCVGFSIQPSSVDRTSSRISSSSPISAIYVTWDKSYNREISEGTEAGKIFTLFPHSQTLSLPNFNNSCSHMLDICALHSQQFWG